MAEEKFKTTLMGGFDKDDVLHQVREMKDAAYAEKSKLIKEKKDQEKVIEDLKKQLEEKDREKRGSADKNRERRIKRTRKDGGKNPGKAETKRETGAPDQ